MADEIYQFAGDIHRSPSRGKLLVMYGPNGCGKTHAARALNHWFKQVRMQIGPMSVRTDEGGEDAKLVESRFVNWAECVDGIKKDQWLVFDHLANECLAILDDIGAEHDPSGIGREKLYMILSRRETMHTIITTNFAPSEWPKKFENRIASRLFRNSVHVDLTQVPDYNAI